MNFDYFQGWRLQHLSEPQFHSLLTVIFLLLSRWTSPCNPQPSPCPCAVTLFGSALSSSHSPHRLQVPGTPRSVRSVLQQAAVGKDSGMAPQLGPCHYTSLNNPARTFPTCTLTSNPAPKNITPEVYPALKKFLRGCAKQRLELLKTDKTNPIQTGPQKSHSQVLGQELPGRALGPGVPYAAKFFLQAGRGNIMLAP